MTKAKLIAKIAQEELRLSTLKERKSDRLDFVEQNVLSIKKALERAYEAGREEKTNKISVAYISYVCYQNAPSSPELSEVILGDIKKGLKKFWIDSFGRTPYCASKIKIDAADEWGDIYVEHPDSEDIFLYVTFDPKYKKQALMELLEKEDEKKWFKIKREVMKEELGLNEDKTNREIDSRFEEKYKREVIWNQ